MKEYSIERQAPWLVGLPESWEIRKVKHFFTVVNGSTPKSSESTYWGGDITWITPADYKTEDKYICSSRKAITQEGLDSCGTSKVPAGSIIVSNRAPIGSIGIAEKGLCTSQGCKSLVKISEINEEYIYYYLSVMSGPLNMLGRGTTFMELSSNDLANFRLPIPTVKDQNAIVQILNKKIAAIKLFCKSIEKSAASGNSNLYIEVYNYGNTVAQNINVKIQDVDFGTIPFLKPGEDWSGICVLGELCEALRLLSADRPNAPRLCGRPVLHHWPCYPQRGLPVLQRSVGC